MASYDARINVLLSGGSDLDRVLTRLNQFESQIQRINATPIDISRTIGRGENADRLGIVQRRIQQLRDDYLELGEAQRRWANGNRTGSGVGGNATINQLKAQSELLESIARNSKLASAQFKEMTIASQMASVKANEAGRERLAVLAEAFSASGSRSRMGNVRGDASLRVVQELIAAGPGITRSEAALSGYINELEDLKKLVPFLSNEYRGLEDAIARVNRELSSAGLRGQSSAIQSARGPATDLGSVKAFTQREAYQKKVNDELSRQVALEERINQGILDQTQKTQLLGRLHQGYDALSENRLDDAIRITREIDKQRFSLERSNRNQKITQNTGSDGLQSAIALEKQRLTAVERILQVEEKIRSAKRITKTEALDYYFQGGLQQLALPFGDESLPGIRGGARRGAGRNIERLGGARTADQAQSTLRLAQANSQLAKSVSAVDTEYNRFLPDTKMLNATGRGIQRLKTDQDQFNESVKSGTRFQQKYNEEQERQRKIYGNRYPVGTVKPDGMAKGAPQGSSPGGTYRTGVFSPIDGQKRLNAIYGANEMLASKLLALEAKGLNVSSEKLTLQNQVNRIQSGTFDINLKNLDLENETLAAITRSISLLQQRSNILKSQSTGYPSSPIGGGVNMPGSPIFNQTPFLERRFGRKGSAAISEGLIGGAFPLLFGQGLGASIGGGLGGSLGGFAGGGLGFGLSLIGTALGTALDELAAAAKDTAASLNDPITNFQKLADAGLLASKSQELQIKNLIEYGNSTKAAAIIQEELAKKIGVLAMRDMANLDDQSVRLGKAWAELNLQIQAAIAGPLAGLLEWTANMINLFTGGTRKKVDEQNFIDSLPADVKKEYIKQKQANLYGAQSDAALRAKFQGQAGPLNMPATKINPERLQEEQDKIRQENRDKDDKQLQRKIEAEDLIRNSQNQSRQFEYQLIDLKRQAIDLQRRVNDDIFNKQQQIQRDQISNDRLRKQIAIDTVDLQYSKMISNEEGRAAAVLSAEADLVKMRSTNAAEIEVARRSLEIDIAKQQRDTQNYIYGLAREADSIRRATLNYEVQIEDYRIAQERKIAEIRRGVMREEEDIQTKRDRGSPVYQGQAMGGGVYAGRTGGGQLDASAGRSSGPHLHAQGGSNIETLRRWVDNALSFNGMTASQLSIKTSGRLGRGAYGPGGHGYIGQDYYIDQATPFALRPGWQSTDMGIRGALGRGLAVKGPNGESFQLGHLVDAVTTAARSGAAQSASAAPVIGRTNTEAAITKANANDAVVQARPVISGVPVSKIGGQQVALDSQGNKIKQDAIALQEKLNKLGEEGALQRVIEAARGENTVKQKTQELRLTQAEAGSIGVMAADKQAIATFDARSLETQKQIEEENKRIIERTSKSNAYNAKEKKAIADAAKEYLENARKSLDVDRQMLQVSQQMRFNSEMAAMELEFQTRGAGAKAGFFGAGAQAYNQELVSGSGDSVKAAEKAQSARRNEVNNEIVQMRENIQSLIDPTNQVIAGAKAIGDAFSEAFKGVVSGSVTGRDALADFFQKTGQHFLEMATQMMAQKMILELIGFGLKSFGLSGGRGIANTFELPGAGFMPTGGFKPFANGGMFTNSIVSSPTLFQFANGGALANGLMGEAGPEAVMPLSRGPGGRLGVDASGMMSASRDALQQASQEVAASREALQQVSEGGSSETGPNGYTPQSKLFAESRQALATSTRSQSVTTSSSSAPLKIETIRIGSLDVVTVEQAKAIADASSVRGNAKQTRLLQSSPSARRSMGI